MKALRAQVGYQRRPGPRGGMAAVTAPNRLKQRFEIAEPNKARVTDITYIKTYEGWLYLAAVINLFSRSLIGWSLWSRIDRSLALDALLKAVWHRQPNTTVVVHSDQGSQFSSHEWQGLLPQSRTRISRRGNCHDNVVAESFF